MEPKIVLTESAAQADREVILRGLVGFNERHVGAANFKPLVLLLQHPPSETTVGGLWGRTAYDWCFVELLFVPEELRGRKLGRDLMMKAEEEARRRSCVGVFLDTFEFQARGFYEKLGYAVFGELPDHPIGTRHFFMHKSLR